MRPVVLLLLIVAAPAAAAPVPRERPADPVGRGYLGITFDQSVALGVAEVRPDTPADRAGLRVGDVFVRVGPIELRERLQMQQLLVSLRPGSRVLVTVRRGQERKTVVVQLGDRPIDIDFVPPPSVIPP